MSYCIIYIILHLHVYYIIYVTCVYIIYSKILKKMRFYFHCQVFTEYVAMQYAILPLSFVKKQSTVC